MIVTSPKNPSEKSIARRRFDTRYRKYESLKRSGNVSRPLTERSVAIIVGRGIELRNTSLYSTEDYYDENLDLKHEAERLAASITSGQADATIVTMPTKAEVASLVQDPTVTDLIFLGHGSLGSFDLTQNVRLAWPDLARYADHLKQGSVVQRTCALFTRPVNVPLGTFIVNDHRNIMAAPGKAFRELEEMDGSIMPVFTEAQVAADALYTFARQKQSDINAGLAG